MSEEIQLLGVQAGVAMLLVSAGLALRAERSRFETRLRTFLGGYAPRVEPAAADVPRRLPPPDSRPSILRRAGLGASQYRLAQAAVSLSPNRFLVLQLAAGLSALALARLGAAWLGLDGTALTVATGLGMLAGLWLPAAVIALRASRRLRRIEAQLPIAIDSIANAIEAGLSLPQALELAGRDLPPPIGLEFRQIMRELGMGLALEEALDRLAGRVPLSDIDIFVAAIHIQYRTGGNLSQVLRTISNTVRERMRIKGEIRTLTAQAKLSAYIVTALPPLIALCMKFLSPSYFEKLLEPGTMRFMLIGAGAGLLTGFYVMMKIADIEV
jgi:tight adherence protein B